MSATIDDGEGTTADTLLGALKEARIFSVKKTGDGRFRVREECDQHFSAALTKEQILALADELRALASEGDA